MEEFLKNLEVNNWLTSVLLVIGIVALVYVVYFFFSKEGKDERGRGIFATASIISFIAMVVMLNIAPFLDKFFTSSTLAFSLGLVFIFSVFCCIQALAILFLKMIR